MPWVNSYKVLDRCGVMSTLMTTPRFGCVLIILESSSTQNLRCLCTSRSPLPVSHRPSLEPDPRINPKLDFDFRTGCSPTVHHPQYLMPVLCNLALIAGTLHPTQPRPRRIVLFSSLNTFLNQFASKSHFKRLSGCRLGSQLRGFVTGVQRNHSTGRTDRSSHI